MKTTLLILGCLLATLIVVQDAAYLSSREVDLVRELEREAEEYDLSREAEKSSEESEPSLTSSELQELDRGFGQNAEEEDRREAEEEELREAEEEERRDAEEEDMIRAAMEEWERDNEGGFGWSAEEEESRDVEEDEEIREAEEEDMIRKAMGERDTDDEGGFGRSADEEESREVEEDEEIREAEEEDMIKKAMGERGADDEGLDKRLLDCKEEGEDCRGVPTCCGQLVCYWKKGIPGLAPGTCVDCVKADQRCQYNNQCCDGLHCDREGSFSIHGECKPKKDAGETCSSNSMCKGNCKKEFWYNWKGVCE